MVSFITQTISDPYWFGQIAAANALAKIYAVGGTPVTALNLVMFPNNQLSKGTLLELLRLAFFPSKQPSNWTWGYCRRFSVAVMIR
jgi:selenophosphate synthase